MNLAAASTLPGRFRRRVFAETSRRPLHRSSMISPKQSPGKASSSRSGRGGRHEVVANVRPPGAGRGDEHFRIMAAGGPGGRVARAISDEFEVEKRLPVWPAGAESGWKSNSGSNHPNDSQDPVNPSVPPTRQNNRNRVHLHGRFSSNTRFPLGLLRMTNPRNRRFRAEKPTGKRTSRCENAGDANSGGASRGNRSIIPHKIQGHGIRVDAPPNFSQGQGTRAEA